MGAPGGWEAHGWMTGFYRNEKLGRESPWAEKFREGSGLRRATGTEWAWRPACSLVCSEAPWLVICPELLLDPDTQDLPSVNPSLTPKKRFHQIAAYRCHLCRQQQKTTKSVRTIRTSRFLWSKSGKKKQEIFLSRADIFFSGSLW